MKKLLILSLAGLLAVTQVSDIVAKKKDKKEKKKQKKAKNQTTTNAESENNYPGDYPE